MPRGRWQSFFIEIVAMLNLPRIDSQGDLVLYFKIILYLKGSYFILINSWKYHFKTYIYLKYNNNSLFYIIYRTFLFVYLKKSGFY